MSCKVNGQSQIVGTRKPLVAPYNMLSPTYFLEVEMRAVMLESFESGPSVREVAVPAPGANEVLVQVRAASINPVDVAVMSGALKDAYEHGFPVVLGRDFAGVVEAVGGAVTRYAPGDDVFGFVHIVDPIVQAGSFAEYIVVAEDSAIAVKPAELDFGAAATLPLSGTAALLSIEVVAPAPGEPVLIAGATGGVGRYAVQLAAASGAVVLATGLPSDEADLRELGADAVFDYTDDVAAAVRARHPDGIAGLVYLVNPPADFASQAGLVSSGGRVATTVHAADVEALRAAGVTAANIFATADSAVIARLGELARRGALTPRIERTYTLGEITEGFSHMASGRARGKLAVEFTGSTHAGGRVSFS
ncbi:MAG: NADP-dependent oxidoreductase [Solirubrobacteraceae bacterium]